MAGATGFEPATLGFGDRCSTVEPHPYNLALTDSPDGRTLARRFHGRKPTYLAENAEKMQGANQIVWGICH